MPFGARRRQKPRPLAAGRRLPAMIDIAGCAQRKPMLATVLGPRGGDDPLRRLGVYLAPRCGARLRSPARRSRAGAGAPAALTARCAGFRERWRPISSRTSSSLNVRARGVSRVARTPTKGLASITPRSTAKANSRRVTASARLADHRPRHGRGWRRA